MSNSIAMAEIEVMPVVNYPRFTENGEEWIASGLLHEEYFANRRKIRELVAAGKLHPREARFEKGRKGTTRFFRRSEADSCLDRRVAGRLTSPQLILAFPGSDRYIIRQLADEGIIKKYGSGRSATYDPEEFRPHFESRTKERPDTDYPTFQEDGERFLAKALLDTLFFASKQTVSQKVADGLLHPRPIRIKHRGRILFFGEGECSLHLERRVAGRMTSPQLVLAIPDCTRSLIKYFAKTEKIQKFGTGRSATYEFEEVRGEIEKLPPLRPASDYPRFSEAGFEWFVCPRIPDHWQCERPTVDRLVAGGIIEQKPVRILGHDRWLFACRVDQLDQQFDRRPKRGLGSARDRRHAEIRVGYRTLEELAKADGESIANLYEARLLGFGEHDLKRYSAPLRRKHRAPITPTPKRKPRGNSKLHPAFGPPRPIDGGFQEYRTQLPGYRKEKAFRLRGWKIRDLRLIKQWEHEQAQKTRGLVPVPRSGQVEGFKYLRIASLVDDEKVRGGRYYMRSAKGAAYKKRLMVDPKDLRKFPKHLAGSHRCYWIEKNGKVRDYWPSTEFISIRIHGTADAPTKCQTRLKHVKGRIVRQDYMARERAPGEYKRDLWLWTPGQFKGGGMLCDRFDPPRLVDCQKSPDGNFLIFAGDDARLLEAFDKKWDTPRSAPTPPANAQVEHQELVQLARKHLPLIPTVLDHAQSADRNSAKAVGGIDRTGAKIEEIRVALEKPKCDATISPQQVSDIAAALHVKPGERKTCIYYSQFFIAPGRLRSLVHSKKISQGKELGSGRNTYMVTEVIPHEPGKFITKILKKNPTFNISGVSGVLTQKTLETSGPRTDDHTHDVGTESSYAARS